MPSPAECCGEFVCGARAGVGMFLRTWAEHAHARLAQLVNFARLGAGEGMAPFRLGLTPVLAGIFILKRRSDCTRALPTNRKEDSGMAVRGQILQSLSLHQNDFLPGTSVRP